MQPDGTTEKVDTQNLAQDRRRREPRKILRPLNHRPRADDGNEPREASARFERVRSLAGLRKVRAGHLGVDPIRFLTSQNTRQTGTLARNEQRPHETFAPEDAYWAPCESVFEGQVVEGFFVARSTIACIG